MGVLDLKSLYHWGTTAEITYLTYIGEVRKNAIEKLTGKRSTAPTQKSLLYRYAKSMLLRRDWGDIDVAQVWAFLKDKLGAEMPVELFEVVKQ